jgi:hypothetical protein
VPGTTQTIISYTPLGDGSCQIDAVVVDACTGEVLAGWNVASGPCPENAPGVNPCINFIITPGGILCGTEWGIEWQLEAAVGFPETFLDLRPYPATLVRWPTAARNGGQPAASGSGSLAYIGYGGGEPGSPALGDWREVTLTLELIPAGPLYLTLPQVGSLALADVGPAGPPTDFHWELPSHPAAGGGPLAGAIPGLGELPPEMPLYAGSAHSPYRLFWSLSYEGYMRECHEGPHPVNGEYECETGSDPGVEDGHWEYRWDDRGQGGEITPQTVEGLPPELAADLNGDGIMDAYWNRNLTIRRMDEAGQVGNPAWAASWNWGGAVYWAVREGQGQIGWP